MAYLYSLRKKQIWTKKISEIFQSLEINQSSKVHVKTMNLAFGTQTLRSGTLRLRSAI